MSAPVFLISHTIHDAARKLWCLRAVTWTTNDVLRSFWEREHDDWCYLLFILLPLCGRKEAISCYLPVRIWFWQGSNCPSCNSQACHVQHNFVRYTCCSICNTFPCHICHCPYNAASLPYEGWWILSIFFQNLDCQHCRNSAGKQCTGSMFRLAGCWNWNHLRRRSTFRATDQLCPPRFL